MQRWLYRYRTVSGDPGEVAGRLVLQGQEEPDATAAVEWGVVTLASTATRLSRIRRLVAYTEAIDGVMQVDADHLHFRENDVTPVPMPFV